MNRIERLIAIAMLLMGCSLTMAAAPAVKSVTGKATYYGSRDDSPSDCKRKALQMARIEALREFGTIVSQNTFQTESDNGRQSESTFLSLSESEVKGEWLGDEGEPKYETSFSNDDTLVVTCTVRGRARALSNEAADFEALVLRNGTTRKNADASFRNGDDMYLLFTAPSDGYLSVYLQDETGEAYCLLPYAYSPDNDVKVKKGYEYVFFDRSRAGTDFGTVEELTLTADGRREYNKVYVIFSPNVFSKAPVRYAQEGAPPSISGEDFSRWLVKCRRNDPKMGVRQMVVSIDPTSQTERIIN